MAYGVNICRTFLLGWLSLSVVSLQAAMAQGQKNNAQKVSELSNKLKASKRGPNVAGIVLAPGVVLAPPVAFIESGFDSNPDKRMLGVQRYSTDESSAFFRSGTGLGLMAFSKRSILNLSAAGSWEHLFDNTYNNRWQGSVEANALFLLAPGLVVATGGLYDHDELSRTEMDVAGSFVEIGYDNKTITGYVRGRILDVDYADDSKSPASPLHVNSVLDSQRKEIAAGLMIGKQNRVGVYGEVNAATVDYTFQPDESLIDRDADDFYAKAGIRVAFTKTLRGDIGWRWNRRELEDPTIKKYSSNYFDAGITWQPSPFFSMRASIDREIAEPSEIYSRLADTISHEVSLKYRPIDPYAISIRGLAQNVREIGDGRKYNTYQIDSEVTYDYATHMQFFANFGYEFVEEGWQFEDYERFRVGIGLRIIPFGKKKSKYKFRNYAQDRSSLIRLPRGAGLAISTGPSWFNLPGTSMTTVVGGPFYDQSLYQIEDHDGNFSGVNTSLELVNIANRNIGGDRALSFNLGGFFSRYRKSDRSDCTFTALSDCIFVNIVDFDKSEENSTGPFGELRTEVEKTVHYWGVHADTRIGHAVPYGYISDPKFPFKVGLSVRGLDQRTELKSTDKLVPFPVRYKERLDTMYYGGYVGVEFLSSLGNGWKLSFDADAGAYYADTNFEGRYSGAVPVGGQDYIQERGQVRLNDGETAFISSVRVGVDKFVGWAYVGLYGQLEYLSYVPTLSYNNDDYAGGSPFGIAGSNVGTKLGSDEAVNYTAGLRVTFNN